MNPIGTTNEEKRKSAIRFFDAAELWAHFSKIQSSISMLLYAQNGQVYLDNEISEPERSAALIR